MKIALFGKNGQLGFELRRTLAVLGEVVACGRHEVDLCAPASITAWLDTVQPQIIVNAAAYTAVDKAESDSATAHAVNCDAPAAMAAWAKAHGARLVHYSTDYVFTGDGEKPWLEDDLTGPLGVYGQSKLDGEKAIVAANPDALIFRTSWVVGAYGANFLKTMLKLMQMKEELSVVGDQIGAPASTRLVSEVTLAGLLVARERNLGGTHVYHLAPTGYTSWHDYVAFIRDWVLREHPQWAAEHLKLKVLKAIPTEAYPTPARRPKNSRMNTAKVQRQFGVELPTWQAGVEEVLEQLFIERPHP